MDAVLLDPAPNAEPAAWVVQGLRGFGESVLSVVPEGFEAYARVFHPAYENRGAERVPLSWADIAARNGREPHKGMQWVGVSAGTSAHYPGDDASDNLDLPEEGNLPLELARRLYPVLERHTNSPETCCFAVWEGFSNLGERIFEAPAFKIPGRELRLFEGSTNALATSFASKAFGRPRQGYGVMVAVPRFSWSWPPPGWNDLKLLLRWHLDRERLVTELSADLEPSFWPHQSANLAWPSDHAWCIATEIDFNTTYIGGS